MCCSVPARGIREKRVFGKRPQACSGRWGGMIEVDGDDVLRAGGRRRELELQAEWFGGGYGNRFRDERGREVVVVDFGEWNRDPGPDFREAVIRIEGEGLMRGGVEIDYRDGDWEVHRHGANPLFGEVVLHVFFQRSAKPFFTRDWRHREVAQVFLGHGEHGEQIGGVFEEGCRRVLPGRCARRLEGVADREVWGELEGLGRLRLDWLGRRVRLARHVFRGQGLFEAVVGALGFGGNRLPMTLLAQRVRLESIRRSPSEAEACLFGLSGFLPNDVASADGGTVREVRGLWDVWWKCRQDWVRRLMTRWDWRLGRQRPAHHPCRRIAIFRILAERWEVFEAAVDGSLGRTDLVKFFSRFSHPYWDWRAVFGPSWRGRKALVGRAWVTELMVNVVLPMREDWARLDRLRLGGVSGRVRRAAERILPRRLHGNSELRRAVVQQGLIHLYDEFCLRDGGMCVGCQYRSD